MSAEVRWGILGPGGNAQRFAREMQGADGAVITAVGSRDLERAQAYAEEFGVARAHGDYAALVADPEVDIVYVASPHSKHFEHAMLALEAGKAVLVEKPFVMNSGEARALIAEARRRELFLMDGLWTLCNPLFIELAARIRDGAIGEIVGYTANVGPMSLPFPRGEALGRLTDRSLGASFLLECHVYSIAVMLTLAPAFGDIADVSAAATFRGDHIDEQAAVLMRSETGNLASIMGGFTFDTQAGPPSQATLTGTTGWARIDDDLFNLHRASIGTATGIESLESDAADRGFAWEIEEAGRAFRAEELESPLVPHSLSLQVIDLLDRARASAGITVGG